MKQEELQKLLSDFEQSKYGKLKQWEIDRNQQLKAVCSDGGKVAGPITKKNKTGLFKRTKLKVIEDAIIGGQECWNQKVENGTSDQHIQKMVEKSLESENHINNQKILCTNCNKEFIGRIYYRWHGDNCKQLKIYQKQLDIILKLNKDTFDANDLYSICLKEDYDRKKFYYRNGLLKNTKYIKCIKKGTNQNNPSTFILIKKDCFL